MSIELASQHRKANDAPIDREHVKAVLRSTGLLVEPSPALLASAAESTLTLAEAAEILGRGAGLSFSEQVDEERGSKG